MGYEPLNVLKPAAPDVWIVDGPAIRFYGIPFSTRMTVVRLSDGSVWLHSPTFADPSLVEAVKSLGPVRHMIAPNWIHYAYIRDWQAVCPEAISWAAPGVAKRAAKKGVPLQFDRDLGGDAPEDWAGQIDQMIVWGSRYHREAVFFHRASSTLILTDLIENFESAYLPWWMRFLARQGRIIDPDGQMPIDMRMTFRGNEDKLRAAVERMIRWGPERVILAHGRWYDRDGVAELQRAFRFVLDR